MTLVSPTARHLTKLSSWFKNEEEVLSWGGPGITYPIKQGRFIVELKLESLRSYALEDKKNQLIGFGQFYQRLDHCHLGRLAIAPEQRGNGHIETLIKRLKEKGELELGIVTNSLFVFSSNIPAVKAYRRLGFKETHYPDKNPLKDCIYMVRS